MSKKLALVSAFVLALAAPAFAGSNDHPVNPPGLTNSTLFNQELGAGALAGAGSLTAGGTFSKGFVSTPTGLNTNQIQAVGITEVNAVAAGSATLGGAVGGNLSGQLNTSAATNSTSYSGSMVQGTGSAWNVTGGGAIAVGGAGALGASGSGTTSSTLH